jgi:hypothetical protein
MMTDERKPLVLSGLSGDGDKRGLECKECGCHHFNVKHTRNAPSSIMRERECKNCGKITRTYEK